jgi:hypothetical protein
MAKGTSMNVLTKWFRGMQTGLGRRLLAPGPRRTVGKRPATRLAIDHLEDRSVPATFTVTNTLDSGLGSLRQAIDDANATSNVGGPDRVEFNIGSAYQNSDGACTIQPLSRYTITDPIVIDGYTQAGASVNTLPQGENAVLKVELDCRWSGLGLEIASDDSTVRGLALNRAANAAIRVTNNHTGNRIEGNFIGTDLSGTQALGCDLGIGIGRADNNLIGGADPAARNIIAGNVYGVWNSGANTTISGNWVGLGANALALPNHDGITDDLNFQSDSNRPSGLLIGGTAPGAGNVISGNSTVGIRVYVRNALIQGNFIGADPTGTIGIGNGMGEGIKVELPNSSYNCVIGGSVPGARNVISGNQTGIGGPAFVLGNYIGTDSTGTHAIGNSQGIRAAAQVGGTTPEERNIIAGNSFGVVNCDVVSGNWVGLGADGAPLANVRGIMDCAVVGGTTPGAGNVISGNGLGIWLFGYSSVRVEGNLIGTDPTGTYAVRNSNGGILLSSPNNIVGGAEPGAGNVISGNPFGIFSGGLAPGSGVQNNVIQGNLIGTDITGTQPIGNSSGISLGGGASNNLIGGSQPGEANIIAFSGIANVHIGGVNNAVLGNSILGGWGIDLKIDGHQTGQPLPNDPQDGDDGYNHWQNYPVLSSASGTMDGTVIKGTLNSLPNTTFRIELFGNTSPQTNGHGPGEHYLGFVNVTTDGNGDASFSVTVPGVDHSRPYISSTATRLEDRGGTLVPTDTSEFSANVVLPPNVAPSADAGGLYVIDESASLTLNASTSSDPENDPLTYSWDINGDGAFGDAIGVQPTLTWSQLNSLGIDDGPFFVDNVRVRVSDGINPVVTSAAASLTVNNVAPTATISNNGPVSYGHSFTVTLSNPSDPSSADTTAGFRYAFNLTGDFTGITYATQPMSTPSQAFNQDAGVYTVYARIIDKDDGFTQYSTTVMVAKATLTGDAATQDALNMAKQGKLNITVSNVSGLLNGDTLTTFLSTAEYFITVGANRYVFVPTAVTPSGSRITIAYTMKNSALASELAAELADNTSAATAVSAGFFMESLNYTLTDEYLTRLFSTVK